MPRMPTIVNDLHLVGNRIKGMLSLTYTLLTQPKEAPTTVRYAQLAFVPIFDNNNNPMGCFVPELYELAKIRGLIDQLAEVEWEQAHPSGTLQERQQQPFYSKLYNADDSAKSAFQLALLPYIYCHYQTDPTTNVRTRIENQEVLFLIEAHAVREFKNAMSVVGLPPVEYKYLITSDYLDGLHLINMRADECRAITLNLNNPADKTTPVERAIFYVASRIAFVMILALALSALSLGTPLAVLGALGIVLVEWCGKEFGTFDTAEFMYRNLSWLSSPGLRSIERISLMKLIKTTFLLASLGAGIVAAAIGTYGLLMSFSIPAVVMGVALPMVALQMGIAVIVAGFAAVMAFTAVIPQNFFWGVGIADKQIDFTQEQRNAAHFQPLDPEIQGEVLARHRREIDDAFTPNHASEEDVAPVARTFTPAREAQTQVQAQAQTQPQAVPQPDPQVVPQPDPQVVPQPDPQAVPQPDPQVVTQQVVSDENVRRVATVLH